MKKVMKAVAALMLMTAVVFAAGCSKPDEPNNGSDNNDVNLEATGTYNGHDYVDLGLPSGTLWATCNVGATTPEGYGDYFAWGETQPKDTYNWSTYKWCNGNYDQLTKYCNYSDYGYNGFADTLTILQPSDDAATVNWGSGWRMPTQTEWQELYDNTTNTWTIRNVYGWFFTASNGNSIFLPAAGCRWGSDLNSVRSIGFYWSSSLVAFGCPYLAWFLFSSDDASAYDDVSAYDYALGRNGGQSVRPVHGN